jgi:hypothetical protein
MLEGEARGAAAMEKGTPATTPKRLETGKVWARVSWHKVCGTTSGAELYQGPQFQKVERKLGSVLPLLTGLLSTPQAALNNRGNAGRAAGAMRGLAWPRAMC